MTPALALVADIGGTHSRLALAENGALRGDTLRRFDNDDHSDFADLLRLYLGDTGARPAGLCLAAAGAVQGDAVSLTNRPWHITGSDLTRLTGCRRIILLNDLQAMGFALAVPAIAGSPLSQSRLVLAIGTGLNAAVAHAHAGKIHVPAAECGYTTLPFTTKADAPYLARIAAAFGAPMVEAILSGPGLVRAHHALTGETRTAQEITSAAPGTDASLALALRVLGATLGSLALTHLPLGGIYLAGSVGRALFAHLERPDFRQHFAARGTYSELVTSFPLRQISDDTAPLHGAAFCLAECRP